jgi:glutamate decarboxylase
VANLGPFELVYNGCGGIPGSCWKIKHWLETNFSLYDLADRMRVRGWQVPAYPMPANRSDMVVQRVLTRFGVSRDLAELMVEDLRKAVEQFAEYPSPRSLTRRLAGGYNHG